MEPQKDPHSPFDHPSYEYKAPETFNSDKSLPERYLSNPPEMYKVVPQFGIAKLAHKSNNYMVFVGDISIVFMGL